MGLLMIFLIAANGLALSCIEALKPEPLHGMPLFAVLGLDLSTAETRMSHGSQDCGGSSIGFELSQKFSPWRWRHRTQAAVGFKGLKQAKNTSSEWF